MGAPGVIKSHHAIIYTSQPRPALVSEQPQRLQNGLPESGMQPGPIRVVTYDRGKALDPMARLDYGDRYEFDYGVPNIRLFGKVHEDSLANLYVQYNSVWSAIQRAVQGTVPRPGTLPTTGSSTTEVPARRVDYSAPNSGPISDDQMRTLLRHYHAYARRHNLVMPDQQLTTQQIHGLAANAEARAQYLRRVRDLWQQDDEEDVGSDSE